MGYEIAICWLCFKAINVKKKLWDHYDFLDNMEQFRSLCKDKKEINNVQVLK